MEIQSGWPLPEGVTSVEVNGYPMAYQERGRETPLILVHGSLNDYRYWNDQIGVFAEYHRVIAVSLRHYFPERWDGRGQTFRYSSMPMTSPSSLENSISGLFTCSATRAEARSRSMSPSVIQR